MRRMQRLLKRCKLNNEGNTLGVVVMGILLLGILGTLILNATATNYEMKIIDNKSKQNFYYVEKAVDEIYAGIGKDAMKAITDAYEEVLGSMVSVDEETGKYRTMTEEEATEAFANSYISKLKEVFYIDEDDSFDVYAIAEVMNTYIEEVDHVEMKVEPVITSDVIIDYDENKITFKDVHVVSHNTQGDYKSEVTTDFVLSVPEVDLGFADSDIRDNPKLYEFALLVDGYETLRKKAPVGSEAEDALQNQTYERLNNPLFPSITVDEGWNPVSNDTSIRGNIYVGTSDVSKKSSLEVKSNNSLNVNSGQFICAGSIVLRNAKASFEGVSDIDSYGVPTNSLHLYAHNLITDRPAGAPAGAELSSTLTIRGDCFISDDLEVNCNNSKVDIMGNYFGYGYSGDDYESDSVQSSYYEGNSVEYEHEKRSAIIINGKNADVRLSQLQTGMDYLVVGGRAYIDLETGTSTGNATYMTGESISIKGNQDIYKITELGSVLYANPVSYSWLQTNGYLTTDNVNFTKLGLNASEAIAKRSGNNVYFYRYTKNPASQTNYFLNQVTNSFLVREALEKSIVDLSVRNLVIDYDPSNTYTVGAITQVHDGVLQEYSEINGVESTGKVDSFFKQLLEEMKYRYQFIRSELTDYDDIGYGYLTMTEVANDTTLYETFVDEDKLRDLCGTGRYTNPNMEEGDIPAEIAEEFCQRVFHSPVTGDMNLMVTMMDNARTGEVLATEHKYGVIVATGDVEITQDFVGIIICGGNLKINAGVNVTACPELVSLLATYDENLSQMFENSGYVAGGESIVQISDLDYQNLITCENWRKN